MQEGNHLHSCVAYLMEAIALLDLDHLIAASMPDTWQRGQALIRNGNAAEQLHGYHLMVAALKATPDAAQTFVEALEDALARDALPIEGGSLGDIHHTDYTVTTIVECNEV